MKSRTIMKPLTAFCLLALLVGQLPAQVSLPVPDKDVPALIAMLESAGPVFEKAKACQQLAIVGDVRAVPALAALLSDQHLSTYARSALEAISGPQADAALRTAAKTLAGNRLIGVLHSIGKRGDRRAIPELTKLLAAKDQDVRTAAARALGRIGTPRTARLLQEAFTKASAKSRRAIANACLIRARQLAAHGEKEQALAMCKVLQDADLPNHIHWSAAYNTVLIQGKDAVPLLLRMLDSGERTQFRMALQAARQLDGINLSAELAARLDKQSPENQALLLIALRDLGDKSVLPKVLDIAKHGKGRARVRAIGALDKLGDESCAPFLFEAATASDQAVAEAARAALVRLPGDQIDALVVGKLGSQDSRELLPAIEIAAKRNIAAAAPALLGLARRGDAKTRQAALRALGPTATVDQLTKLIDLTVVALESKDSVIVRNALKSACVRMPQAQCANVLATAIPNAPTAVKVILLEQLAVVGGSKALQTVVAAARSDNEAMRDTATQLLGKWLTADAAPAILELAKSLPDGKYRIRALRGYIRIARQLSMTPKQRMGVCRNALAIAHRSAEKKLVLDVLRRYPCAQGLQIAQPLLKDKELGQAARLTIASITEAIHTADARETGFVPLFDGKTLDGWKGNKKFWRVENGAIVGGSLTTLVKHNEFLRTEKKFTDFELRLQFKLLGQRTNGGVQLRSQEIPNHFEVSGYQADLGDGWWGCLYDESRRRKILAGPPTNQRAKPIREGQWNDYRIRCEGSRIQLWINGVQTVDYTEQDPNIPRMGIIAVQVHGKLKMEARYRNLRIKKL